MPVNVPVPPDWEHDPLQRFANIDNTTAGFTELRTHGVSGPPPEDVLQYPAGAVTIVEGNADSGFWRRWRLGGDLDDVPNNRHLEAYCWGGLTSRASLQALWLLLLPFSLVNMALPPYAGKKGGEFSARLAVSLLRVLALTFTVTLALAGAEITMDLGAWQCGANPGCRTNLGPWDLIGKLHDHSGPRLAIGGGLLFLVLFLLLFAGRVRFRPLRDGELAPSPLVPRFVKDQQVVEDHQGTQKAGRIRPVLGDPKFWVVDHSTRWLRCLHTIAWCAVIGAVATGALHAVTPRGTGNRIGGALLWANLGVLALVFVLVTRQYFGRGGSGGTRRTTGYRWVNLAAIVLLVASLLATSAYMPDSAETGHPVLPYVQGAMGRLAFGQGIILLILAACVGVLAVQARKPAPASGYEPMLGGMLALVVASLGWLLGLTQSAGYGLWVADRIEAAAGESTFHLALPTFYRWIDAWAVLALCVALAWAGFLFCRVVHQTSEKAKKVKGYSRNPDLSGSPGQRASDLERTARARLTARWWILARSVETVPVMLAAVTAAGFVLAVLAIVAYANAVGPSPFYQFLFHRTLTGWFPSTGWVSHIPSAGAWVITAGTALLLAVAYAAYRKQSTRRIVGILWDITTFWPRANHPLTPACSAERAVPQLADRIAQLTRNDTDFLVLSAHSQGSVLAAAALLRLEQDPAHCDRLERVSLLTYGSPLRRLYARAFPAYFSDHVLQQAREDVGGWWLNLWAWTDPIGADIALPAVSSVPANRREPPSAEQRADGKAPRAAPKFTGLDWQMVPDPLTLDVDLRTGEQVGVCDHSGYRNRPEYPVAVESMHQLPTAEQHILAASDGSPLTGTSSYVLRLTADKLPADTEAWSVTLYDARGGLVNSILARYSLGSQSEQLIKSGHGDINLYVQADAPAEAMEPNWLPAPAGGFTLVLRTSWPSSGMPDGWVAPSLDISVLAGG
jgi:hypothetical protein